LRNRNRNFLGKGILMSRKSIKQKPHLTRAPLHQQLTDVLRDEVLTTQKPGQRLPPEPKLAERFDVSILTVREALRALTQEGLLVRKQGSGTYVADRRSHQHVALVTQFDLWGLHRSAFHLRVLHS
jgi:DNA-binding GntR family transcriptional regulator